MPTITVREQGTTAAGFEVAVVFDGRAQYPRTIADPFANAPQREQQLEWYFEQWIRFPFTDAVTAESAAAGVRDYGQQLFEQVFGDRQVYSEYEKVRGALSQLQIEIEGQTPEFQALHWEALRDPTLPRPLAIDCVMVRKHLRSQSAAAMVQQFPTINLLVVTARPDEEQDVGYRTISRPLIEAIQQSQLRVNIEILRPGTFEALSRCLAQPEKQGFYHIIHFDLHGSLATYEQLQKGVAQNRYVYQMGYGQTPLSPYSGVKAYLFFEGEEKGQAIPVEAGDLASLLTGAGIPVCVLNACQSGKQIRQNSSAASPEPSDETDDQRETSLGSRLMAAGMQMVVAMGYSVTVSAAKLLMQQVYRELFNQRGMTEALRLGRRELYMNKQRKVYYDQTVTLEDWLLPVVYCNQTVNLNLRPFTFDEEEQHYAALEAQYRFQPPEYGFFGRDLDILKLEKALLKHNVVLLQGMGGTGKTTLLTYLQEWWQTTHFAEQIFYFGYDQRAWTLEQILHEIGKRVYGRQEQALFQTINLAAQVGKLTTTLCAQPHLLILDNLESVTGEALAIPNTLPAAEQNKIRDFLTRLVGGKTRVVLGSRCGEAWLQSVFRNNVYELRGLDPEAQTDLATQILQRHVGSASRIQTLMQDADCKRLMKLLAGYPLAMEVVLANLKQQTPNQILQALQAADINLDTNSDDKTKSILKCVEYSHSQLSPDAQKLLLCLAPFSNFLVRDFIPQYAEELQQLEPFQDYAFDQFDAAIQEAIDWGLLSPHESGIPSFLTIQPIFPYFLKTRLKEQDNATGEALRTGFKQHYQSLAAAYQQWMNSQNPQERQTGIVFCRLEYENLYSGLQSALESYDGIGIYYCLVTFFNLTNDIQGGLNLAERVYEALSAYPAESKQQNIREQIVRVLVQIGNAYLQLKQYSQAESSYQKALEALQTLDSLPKQQKQALQASIYHQLGRVAEELREYEQAQAYYQQALDIKIEFGDRFSQASTYHPDCLTEVGETQ